MPYRIRTAYLSLTVAAFAACSNSNEPRAPGPPANISVSAGSGQHGSAGTDLIAPIVAKVTDANGQSVPDVAVQFSVLAGSGSVSPSEALTNRSGLAIATWRLGTSANQASAVVAKLINPSSGVLLDTAMFSATVDAGAPASVFQMSNIPYSAYGTRVVPDLIVEVHDLYGNFVTGTPVTWTASSGGGSITPATSNTNGQGIAQATATLGPTPATNTFTATAGTISTTFVIEGREMTEHIAVFSSGGGFGLGRTSSGKLVAALIDAGAVEVFPPGATTGTSIPVGANPVMLVIDAAGNFAYVANNPDVLNIVDLRTNALVQSVQVPGALTVALAPRGDRLFVAGYAAWVYTVSLSTRTVTDSVAFPNGAWGIAFRTVGTDSSMYVTSREDGTITEINMRTNTASRVFTIGGRPHGLAITRDNLTLFAADVEEGFVKVVDIATGGVVTSIPLPYAFEIAISDDGQTAYATTDDGYMAVIDVASRTVTRRADTGYQARQVVVDPAGDKAWAANLGGWIDLIRR
jgi:DNA-binding beta-propeller fold protein YncE